GGGAPRLRARAAELAASAALRGGRADGLGADAGHRRGERVAAGRLHRRDARDRVQRGVPARRARVARRRRARPEADQPAPAGGHELAGRRLHVPDHAHPVGRLIVETVSLRNYRSYARLEVGLEPGLVLVVGPNGAGKTNLLESLHVGTQGFSPRTRNDARLIRFGREGARIALTGDRAGSPLELNVILHAGAAKRASLNGARLQAAEQLRSEVAALVFTPDRLVVVKGGPAARRAYFDRALGRGTPAQAALPAEYGAALAQRNASLRGISLGYSTREALRPWTERVADLGAQLVAARRDVIAALEPLFAARAGELGLVDAALRYEADPPS